jgi:pimeloyl-ACP methyl ester carboxylesterase
MCDIKTGSVSAFILKTSLPAMHNAPSLRVVPVFLTALVLAVTSGGAHSESPGDTPYRMLREAYAASDPNAAANAYAEDAVYTELYPDAPPLALSGRTRIRDQFTKYIGQFAGPDRSRRIDINFRFVSRTQRSAGSTDAGFYRLLVSDADGRNPERFYGSFATVSDSGKFVFDSSGSATVAEFESSPGPVMFAAADESLESTFYDRLTGNYIDGSGCRVLVTRSMWRLYAFDNCSRVWRGLERDAGHLWRGGDTVIDANGKTAYRFESADAASSNTGVDDIVSLRIERPGAATRILNALPKYRREQVEFVAKGVRLRGELILPQAARDILSPGVVLVHGSGPQDRHGYASIMALIAERFAQAGFAVLSYDKRGVGASQGDWTTAGFDVLGADAHAGLAFLRNHAGIDPENVGFSGSSQAGWVAAAAVRDGASPAFTLLVGAAGAALTVEEQNIYNTRVRMQCAGISKDSIDIALEQQRAFFAARRDAAQSDRLRQISQLAARNPALENWLFPDSVRNDAPAQWYDVLDPDFDPLPVWAAYPGRAYFLFSDNDDSTPTAVATARLSTTRVSGIRRVHTLKGAQHLGLAAKSLCQGEIGAADGFHPDFFPSLDRWMNEIRSLIPY